MIYFFLNSEETFLGKICAKPGLVLFVYFRSFLNAITNVVHNLTMTRKSIDGVLGIRTQDCKMVGTDEATLLWWTIYSSIVGFSEEFYFKSFLSLSRDSLASFDVKSIER